MRPKVMGFMETEPKIQKQLGATTTTRACRGEFTPGDHQNKQVNIKKVAPPDKTTMRQASLQYAWVFVTLSKPAMTVHTTPPVMTILEMLAGWQWQNTDWPAKQFWEQPFDKARMEVTDIERRRVNVRPSPLYMYPKSGRNHFQTYCGRSLREGPRLMPMILWI